MLLRKQLFWPALLTYTWLMGWALYSTGLSIVAQKGEVYFQAGVSLLSLALPWAALGLRKKTQSMRLILFSVLSLLSLIPMSIFMDTSAASLNAQWPAFLLVGFGLSLLFTFGLPLYALVIIGIVTCKNLGSKMLLTMKILLIPSILYFLAGCSAVSGWQ